MAFNLIDESWLPVRTASGGRRLIRPDQIAEPDILWPDWPRPDLNIACLELLIGLVFLADPPENRKDWDKRSHDPARLREKLQPLRPAFNLDGDGPRFLQDFDPLDAAPNPPDMLFIDSAGAQTAKNNADLMVRRARYPRLAPGLAAMALYTLQAFAPSGGAGNRTSMRGGGPMTTLVEPEAGGLAALVWANTPYGAQQGPEALPWMRPTRTSEKGQVVTPPDRPDRPSAEAFFGMPRRLRLVFEGEEVCGVIQKPYGANYAAWAHPLTPYYRPKSGAMPLPVHPKPGPFGYRNWLGVVLSQPGDALRHRARTVETWMDRRRGKVALLVAGWAMDNMKPLDFTFSRQPLPMLPEDRAARLRGMIRGAENAASALRQALRPVLGVEDAKASLLKSADEAFYLRTQARFDALAQDLAGGRTADAIVQEWRRAMRDVALDLFDARALPGLPDREMDEIEAVVGARRHLTALFAGRGKAGAKLFDALDLAPPETGKDAA